ncbi:MAG TPA: GNAT family N-acetyltransferase [Devosiaceae bacterium]|nr:GNAT family N-acetyltransferase [Devosiaceae bacterium]
MDARINAEGVEPPVEHRPGPGGGRWFVRLEDGTEAEMTYTRVAPDAISLDHTYTPPVHRGQDIAFRVMRAVIEDARATGTRIVPRCAYAVAQFRRRPEWADVLAG